MIILSTKDNNMLIIKWNGYRRALSSFFYYLSQSQLISKIRAHSRILAASYDFLAILFAWLVSCWILINTYPENAHALFASYWHPLLLQLGWILPAQMSLFWLFGLYRGFWRFTSTQDLSKIFYVSVLGSGIIWVTLRVQIQSDLLFSRYI